MSQPEDWAIQGPFSIPDGEVTSHLDVIGNSVEACGPHLSNGNHCLSHVSTYGGMTHVGEVDKPQRDRANRTFPGQRASLWPGQV